MNSVRMEDVRCTVEDIYALPEGQRAELIDGYMYMMAPPKRQHQRILINLATEINNYIRRVSGNCEVVAAPFGVFLFNDDSNFVEPDISVICDPSKLDEDGCHGAPDWVIEIISPSSRKMDCIIKLDRYRRAGVREYWIVDPKTETVRVCNFEKGENEERDYGFNDVVRVGIYADLEIDFKTITT